MEAKIKEIFDSVQGEGPFVGVNQLFIRFCGCNLACKYCDTDFDGVNSQLYTPQKLAEYIFSKYDLNKIHSFSFTGGEPLLNADFINEFINLFNKYTYKFTSGKNKMLMYLETNATLPNDLLKIKDKIDIISADIKLQSATGIDTLDCHDLFFKYCSGVYTFAKIVFNDNITNDEIKKCSDLAIKYNLDLILQPQMNGDIMSVNNIFCQNIFHKFLEFTPNVRLIPQVHKFLDIR